MTEAARPSLTLADFIDINYSGLKAKFDLSTDEEKVEIMTRLNNVLSGLGDAIGKEREDLDRVIEEAENTREVAAALLPLTSL